MPNDILIFTPTYNEAGNIGKLLEQLLALDLAADILVIDDNSSDGTGKIVQDIAAAHPNVTLKSRAGKLGIGSAHLAALQFAKQAGYRVLVTLDADFSHQPKDIPRFLAMAEDYDVVVGSRFVEKGSLREWNAYRKFMTHVGHFLTRTLLQMPYDASGALRAYRMDRISIDAVTAINSRDYEFFFESLKLLMAAGYQIGEVPVELSARVYGHSKMQVAHVVQGVVRLVRLSLKCGLFGGDFRRRIQGRAGRPDAEQMRVAWDDYWGDKKAKVDRSFYDYIASFYRNRLIKPMLNYFIEKTFKPGAELLHAGCGGGEVDTDVVRYARVTAVDISPNAIAKYKALHGDRVGTVVADIFHLGDIGRKFDGIYNLGVMEHFEEEQIRMLFLEFNRALKPGGHILILWPPRYGLSVAALYAIHFVLNTIFRRGVQLHPPEPTKVRSRAQISGYLDATGFKLQSMNFGVRDAFTYVVIVAEKISEFDRQDAGVRALA